VLKPPTLTSYHWIAHPPAAADLSLPPSSFPLREDGTYLTPKEALCILCQIVRGLAHMRSMGIYHIDIKPDNTLMERTDSGEWRAMVRSKRRVGWGV
jgi:serine/threonine protein kinase